LAYPPFLLREGAARMRSIQSEATDRESPERQPIRIAAVLPGFVWMLRMPQHDKQGGMRKSYSSRS
jgi:hypothetical protein